MESILIFFCCAIYYSARIGILFWSIGVFLLAYMPCLECFLCTSIFSASILGSNNYTFYF